jgi:hypothetical protein
VTLEVTFWDVPSLKVAVARSCRVPPAGRETKLGEIWILATTAEVTVRAEELLIAPDCAVMVVVPGARLVASPDELIVATEVLLDVQVTMVVRSCVPPSVIVPVAAYCCVVPAATRAAWGETASVASVAGPTVRVAVADCPP